MILHAVFDILAWITALATLLVLRRTWFAEGSKVPRRPAYLAAVLFGAGSGAWLLGTANLWLSGIHQTARSIEGAIFGAVLAVEIYKRVAGIKERTGAIYALPLVLGIAVGRIGCQLSGLEDQTYGIATLANWGWDHGDGILRHPVAFYETIAMVLFAMTYCVMMWRRNAFIRDNGFYLALGFYALQRFGLETLKPYGTAALGLTLFQWVAALLLVYAALMVAGQRAGSKP